MRTTRVYVATSFANREEARDLMRTLECLGMNISHDWTNYSIDWESPDLHGFVRQCGTQDYNGVIDSDVVILINHMAARDAMAEFGIALGLGKPVYVLHPRRRGSVFFHLATGCFESVEALVAALKGEPIEEQRGAAPG